MPNETLLYKMSCFRKNKQTKQNPGLRAGDSGESFDDTTRQLYDFASLNFSVSLANESNAISPTAFTRAQ